MLREIIVIDTLGTVNVKDSLFKGNEEYKRMAFLPVEGVEDSVFKIKSMIIDKNGTRFLFLRSKFQKILFCMIKTKIY